jgi:hypothetical protein
MEKLMPFKPNYRFARSERERLKKAKKDEKLRRQQERAPLHEDDAPTVTDQTATDQTATDQTATDKTEGDPSTGSVSA